MDNLCLDRDVTTSQEPKCPLSTWHIEDSCLLSSAYGKGSRQQEDKEPKMASAAPPHAFHINLSKGSGAWNEVAYHLSILGTLHWRRPRCVHCVTRFAAILILLLSTMFDIGLIGSTQNVTWLCAAGMGATVVAISWLTVNKAYVSSNWFFWSLWRRKSTIWGLMQETSLHFLMRAAQLLLKCTFNKWWNTCFLFQKATVVMTHNQHHHLHLWSS